MEESVKARPVVVFVHGFGSSRACWTCNGVARTRRRGRPLLADLVSDDPIFSDWDVDFFEYDTRFLSLNPLTRIPTIFEIGEKLKTWLRARGYHRRPLTLVGHSQGGLVILSYISNLLDEEEAASLSYVRQVLMIATPQKGSAVLLTARTLLGRFIRHAQETRLRPLDDSVDSLLARITRDVLHANTRDRDDRWPVPIRAFFATSDGVVTKESVRGELDAGALDSLPGDHSSVLQPDGSEDVRYLAIKQALLRPIGHRKVFLIERYSTSITVRPEATTFAMQFKNRVGPLPVSNVCTLSRTVTFADRNVCNDRFRLRYRTLGRDSCLTYLTGGNPARGELLASDLQGYRDEGRQINYYYRPQKGVCDTCYLDLTIYNGFGDGNTNLHFHLAPLDEPLRMIEELEYTVDLSPYLAEGFEVSEPRLFHYPHNPAVCDDLCGARVERYRRAPDTVRLAAGVWRWTLQDVPGGVIDIVWQLQPVVEPHVAHPAKLTHSGGRDPDAGAGRTLTAGPDAVT